MLEACLAPNSMSCQCMLTCLSHEGRGAPAILGSLDRSRPSSQISVSHPPNTPQCGPHAHTRTHAPTHTRISMHAEVCNPLQALPMSCLPAAGQGCITFAPLALADGNIPIAAKDWAKEDHSPAADSPMSATVFCAKGVVPTFVLSL